MSNRIRARADLLDRYPHALDSLAHRTSNNRRALMPRIVIRDDHEIGSLRCRAHRRTLVLIAISARTDNNNHSTTPECAIPNSGPHHLFDRVRRMGIVNNEIDTGDRSD